MSEQDPGSDPPSPPDPQAGWGTTPSGPQGAPPYPPMYGGGYPPPYGYQPFPPPRSTNGLAIASLVLGILWIYWLGSVLALIFGYIARSQIKESGGRQDGEGMALAGIILGWIGVGILTVVIGGGVLIAFLDTP
ncbi:DUF4190 domain-containing protein [Nocardioides sp. Root140]|uniref:DUF4190 domain-containing protein n=1 Tax=Nocardioides sp. Root140 TaxID=1736460 RepID=UPI00138EDB7D|nr:DUF4190 domain-containing protein [Nocardioides sp. Root140]